MASNRRSFIGHSARFLGGALVLPPLLAACGGDDDEAASTTDAAGTTPGTAAATTPAATTGGSAPATVGTVRTVFNWVPDVEWSAWYLADSNGLFAANGVTAEFLHGGPNTPAVAQVLAAGDADVGVASDELQLIKANAEGADFVILGAMYQRSPSGFCWLAETPIATAEDLVGKRLGLTTGDEIRVDAVFVVNDLEPDYETVQMSFDPQPLIDGDADAITCYVTNQPIQLALQGIAAESAPFSDFGLKAFGDVLFASGAYVEANRDLLVAYFAGLLAGVEANVADPMAVIPLLTDVYGKDADIDPEYSAAGNPAYIALLTSDYTEANGLLMIDPTYLENEVYPSYEAAGETDLPPVAELLDATVMADAHDALRITAVDPLALGYRKSDPPMARNFAVVRVETDTGLVGWGEASTNWGHMYPTVFVAAVRDVSAAPLLGTDPTDVRGRLRQLHVILDGYLGWEGLTSQVTAAIEIACWDILGQACGLPLHRLLGAANRPLRLYGTGTTMFEETAAYHAHYFDDAVAHGFGGMKVRLGRAVDADVETVAAVREHVGPDAFIGVDSYWFHDARTALDVAERLRPLGVGFFEEPVPQIRVDELAWLTARSPIPVAVGERVYSAAQFDDLARRGAANVFQPDASVCGGILACMDVAAAARQRGIAVYPHVGGPTIIGLAANLHWAVAADVDWMEYDIDPYQPLVDGFGSLGLGTISDGELAAPDGPGLGVALPDDVAERFPYVAGDTYTDVFPDHETGKSKA